MISPNILFKARFLENPYSKTKIEKKEIMGKKVVPGEQNMPESVKQMIDERIYHCPACGIENILYDFEELPPDAGKHFAELAIELSARDKNAAMCPIVGWCPVCKKYSTCSIGFEHKKKYKSYVKDRRRYS